MADVSGAVQMHARATNYIAAAGLDHEVAWQRNSDPASISKSIFLREAAWVVLCSGFRKWLIRPGLRPHLTLFLQLGFGVCDRSIVSCLPSCSASLVSRHRKTFCYCGHCPPGRQHTFRRSEICPYESSYKLVASVPLYRTNNCLASRRESLRDSMFQNLIDIWYVSLSDWGSAGRGNYVQLSLTPVGRRSK